MDNQPSNDREVISIWKTIVKINSADYFITALVLVCVAITVTVIVLSMPALN